MPETEQRRVSDVGRVVAPAAASTRRSVPLCRNLLVQQLAVHVHLGVGGANHAAQRCIESARNSSGNDKNQCNPPCQLYAVIFRAKSLPAII